jgi:cytochrome c biogenesis protein CcmG/thiol:disulfide interchange protein DsbE
MRNAFILASILCVLALAATAQSPKTTNSSTGRNPAPDFNLKDATGKDVTLADLKGKVVLVNFWATWCEGCQVEIPWFVEFQKEYAGRGLVVVGISMDDDGWKSVKPWIEKKKVNYPIVIGTEGLGKQYGLLSMPLTALVDREGKIADVHQGIVDKMATEQKIRDLLQR